MSFESLFPFEIFEPEDILLDDLSQTRTVAQFIRNIEAWLSLFNEKGVKRGQTIALFMANRVEFIELIVASIMGGYRIAPINWHSTKFEREQLLELLDPDLVIVDGSIGMSFPLVYKILLLHEVCLGDCLEQGNFEHMEPGEILLFTGGTTGLPKAVKRFNYESVQVLADSFRALGKKSGLNGEAEHLVAGPLYHAAPLYYALYDLFNGAKLVIMPRWDAKQALRLLSLRKIKHTHLVPTQLLRLLKLPDSFKKAFPVSELNLILHGAASIPEGSKKQLIVWLGPVLVEYWGGSESGLCTRIDSDDWLHHVGSVGPAANGYQIRIVDDESYEELSAGQVGLIQVKHSSGRLPFSYEFAQTPEGPWFDLGDMGWLDEQGYLYIADRLKNKIIKGGVNIYPAEIENRVLAEEAVVDAVVIPQNNDDMGEVPVLILVTPQEASNLREAISSALFSLDKFKWPKSIYVVNALPRNPNGKLRKTDVTTMIEKGDFLHFIEL